MWNSALADDEIQLSENCGTFTRARNITGQLTASVLCGFTREGMPVGLQIVGRDWIGSNNCHRLADIPGPHCTAYIATLPTPRLRLGSLLEHLLYGTNVPTIPRQLGRFSPSSPRSR